MDAFLVDGVRTAIANYTGTLSSVRADDLAAHVIKVLLARFPSIPDDALSDVLMGCANQAGEDNRNVARMALLLAGVSPSVPGVTVNRLCASGMTSAIQAAWGASAGEGDLFIAGGVEQMTRAPYVLSKSTSAFARNAELFDTTMGWRFINPKMQEMFGTDSMGETAENVAERYGISRDDQDLFAFRSQQKAAVAQASGRFKCEIAPLDVAAPKGSPKGTSIRFETDEFIKGDTSLDVLKKLRPAFKKEGSVTAGNASGINDGACSLLISSSNGIRTHALSPKAKIVASASAGVEPRVMGMGPVPAVKKVLEHSGINLANIGVIELNEAFAAQSLACLRELGIADDDSRVNPNGGAIALGHPLGMSGARLLLTAMHELHLRQEKYALCTMCVGVGQGVAVILERI